MVQLTVTTNTNTVNLSVQKYTPISGLSPDDLAGIQNANGLNAGNPAATMGDISGKTDKGGYEGTAMDLYQQSKIIRNEVYSYPNWWEGMKIPVSVDSNGRAIFDYDVDKILEGDILSKTPYYISPDGLQANDGLTPATPQRRISEVIAGGAELIYMLPGIYYRDTFVGSGLDIAGNDLFIIGLGNVYISTGQKNLVWTLDTDNTYSSTRSTVEGVIDTDFLTDEGLFTEYPRQATLAECKALAGSWYQSGSTIYVHKLDGTIPNNNIIVNVSLSQSIQSDAGRIYYKNLNFLGVNINILGKSISSTLEAYLKNVKNQYPRVHYSQTPFYDGVVINGAKISIIQNCFIENQYMDGINYTDNLGVEQKAVEINCRVSNVGLASGANQCSTAHSGVKILRIGANYTSGRPQVIADVNVGTQSILIGCELNASSPDTTTAFYGADADVFGCKIYGNKLIKEVDESEGGITVSNSILEISGTEGSVTISN